MSNSKKNKSIRFIFTIITSVVMAFLLVLGNLTGDKLNVTAESNIIYFDLAAGNVTIENTTYSGSVYELDVKTNKYSIKTVSGTRASNDVYHIYQTGLEDENDPTSRFRYEDVGVDTSIPQILKENGVKETDVVAYMNAWDDLAKNTYKRTPTEKIININAAGTTTNIVLDNIWSNYQKGTGGLNIPNHSTGNSITNLQLKGDNRLLRLYYVNSLLKGSSKLTFSSYYGDDTYLGTLTVIGNQTPIKYNGAYRTPSSPGSDTFVIGNVPYSHWDSVIGATDGTDHSCGMYFTSGTVYAGSTKWENCTAIGGGGNGTGEVIVNGGRVIAVAATTGTAIGGGIAHQAQGGKGYVTVNSGEVYAYNFGAPYAETLASGERLTMINSYGGAEFIPGTAIGGGSSVKSAGNLGEVVINGGYVYAESLGGAGIGGGNTVENNGGDATIKINGGEVHSISTHATLDTIIDARGNSVTTVVESGAGIGGGFSEKSNGGKGAVTITGGKVTANGIGGGNTINGVGGDANVTISGGTTKANTIGGGFSSTQGFANGKVTVTGGCIDTEMAAIPTDGKGNMVFMTRVSLYKNSIEQTDLKVNSLVGANLGNYTSTSNDPSVEAKGMHDVYTDVNGMLYFFLPEGCTITDAKDVSGGTYSALEELDGEIAVKEIGKLIYQSSKEHCMINVISSSFYELYNDIDCYDMFNGVRFVETNSTFTFYVKVLKDENNNYYEVTPYFSIDEGNGNKVFREGKMEYVSEGLYKITVTASVDTEISFMIKQDTTTYFTLDLTNGDIYVSLNDDKSLRIEQDGYVLSGINPVLYFTSGGYPTSNRIIVDAPEIKINSIIDSLVVSSSEPPVEVLAGELVMASSPSDDYIISSGGPAIEVAEGATVTLVSDEMSSLKIIGKEGEPAIKGQGAVVIEDLGGFLVLNEKTTSAGDPPQLSVGTYDYRSSEAGKMPYVAELFDGRFTFTLIGYIQDNVLYGLDESLKGNKEDFTARGISTSFINVNSSNGEVIDGNYVITLTTTDNNFISSPILIGASGSQLSGESGGHYSWVKTSNTSGTLTIYGPSFDSGNVTIYSSSGGEMPYTALDYEGVYDNIEHSIFIRVFNTTRFKIYYSEEDIFSNKTLTDEQIELGNFEALLVNPTYTNVGTKTVYWYIYDTETVERYASVTGKNKVVISKGDNTWDNTLSCPDVILSNLPNPYISSKWGTPEFTYYSRSGESGNYSYTEVTLDTIQQNVGTYYVKANVPASSEGNYDEIETSYYIRFKVFETSIYTSTSFDLSKISTSSAINLSIMPNGAFTIFYQFNASSDMSLRLKSNVITNSDLKPGTEIIMIDFSGANPIYYYFLINEERIKAYPEGTPTYLEVNIDLEEFVMMGGSANYSLQQGKETSLQFAIQLPEDNISTNDEITIISVDLLDLVKADPIVFKDKTITVTTNLTSTISDIEISNVSSTQNNSTEIEFEIGTNSETGYNNVLYFTVTESSMPYPLHDSIINLDLYNASGKYNSIKPTIVIGNRIIFNLGNTPATDITYVLRLGNMEVSDNYHIEAEIRVIEENHDFVYLSADAVSLSSSSSSFKITSKDITRLNVTEKNNVRLITKDVNSLTFNVQSNANKKDSDANVVEIYIAQKIPNVGYSQFEFITQQVLNVVEDGKTYSTTTLTVPVGGLKLYTGTYRIKFVQGDTVCYYNIVVDLE